MSEIQVSERDERGRFAAGNPGGPGRPRRAVELEYLAALGDELTLDSWREIVRRAVEDAKAGEPKAREWVTKYALGGAQSLSLMALAVREQASVSVDDEILATADIQRGEADMRGMFSDEPVLKALFNRLSAEQAAEREAELAEQRARREARRLAKAQAQAE